MSSNTEPEVFTIAVVDAVLSDLRRRLSMVRWPDEIADTGWQYGTKLSYLRELIAYWEHAYDWREQERLLNSFDQYRVQLDDITLHYIQQPGIGPAALCWVQEPGHEVTRAGSVRRRGHGLAVYRPQSGRKGKLYRNPKLTDLVRFQVLQMKRRLGLGSK